MYFAILDRFKNQPMVFLMGALFLVLVFNFLNNIGLVGGIAFIGILVALIILVTVYMYPVYGLVLHLFSSFLMFFILYRLVGTRAVPVGILLDSFNLFILLVLLQKGILKGFNTTVGILLVIWFFICAAQIGNPMVASRAAWIHAMRMVFNTVVPFFLIYSLMKNGTNVLKPILISWISFCTLAALYTFYQEFVDLPPWDRRFMYSDPHTVKLFTTFGYIRKFAFLGNPMENGLILFCGTNLCLGLAVISGFKRRYQILFLIITLMNATAMSFTGTRTATVLFVLGIASYVLLWNKRILWIGVLGAAFLLVGYVGATGGGRGMKVMTSAFDSNDPSMKARLNNQNTLRAYLYRSPIGYGLGSIGYLARKYSPYTGIARIPPDSELVRVIVETGMIGCAYYLFMFFMFMKKASNTLLQPGDDFTKNFRIVCIVVLLTILLGHYPQQILAINAIKTLVGTLLAYISLTPEEADRISWLNKEKLPNRT